MLCFLQEILDTGAEIKPFAGNSRFLESAMQYGLKCFWGAFPNIPYRHWSGATGAQAAKPCADIIVICEAYFNPIELLCFDNINSHSPSCLENGLLLAACFVLDHCFFVQFSAFVAHGFIKHARLAAIGAKLNTAKSLTTVAEIIDASPLARFHRALRFSAFFSARVFSTASLTAMS